MNKLLLPILAVLGGLFLFKKAKATPGDVFDTTPTPEGETAPDVSPSGDDLADALRDGLSQVFTLYGRDTARKVEQMFRLETADFTSGGFRKTNGPGQKAFTATFPFGWPTRGTSPEDYRAPVPLVDNGEQAVSLFVVYKEVQTAMRYLAQFLTDHAGNVGRWNSTDAATASNYAAHVYGMAHPIVDTL